MNKIPINLPGIFLPLFSYLVLAMTSLVSAAEPPHAVIVVGTHHYAPQKTMPLFAAELQRLGFRTTVINPDWDPEKDGRGLPGIEALESADVAVFFTRFLKLDDDQLSPITKYLESGKPVVGLRTSTHGFDYPEGHPRRDLNIGFGRDALGTPYLIHLAGKTQIARVKEASTHPILTGVYTDTWESPGTLYLTKTEPGVEPLLVGTGNAKRVGKVTNQFGTHDVQKTMTDTVAWTWKNKWGGRTFATSLGHAGDFNVPQSMRGMVNGVFWAAGLDVPTAKTEIRTFAAVSQPKKRTAKPKRNEPQATKPVSKASPQNASTHMLVYGNGFAERLLETGYFEAYLQMQRKPVKLRSLALNGDQLHYRARPFGVENHLRELLKAWRGIKCCSVSALTKRLMKCRSTSLSST